MTKPWRVTEQAQHSLLEIAVWTFETFEPRQADAYEQDILSKLDDISAGVAHSQSCNLLVGGHIEEDLRFSRVGAHHLIYVEYDNIFILLDLLHQSADLERRLSHIAGKTQI